MKEISKGVYYLGLHDYDRKIFDQLVPLPQGTTYNSYLVRGSEKCALVDTMYVKFSSAYIDMIKAANVCPDYIVCNHAEPDHTGVLPQLCFAKAGEIVRYYIHNFINGNLAGGARNVSMC